MKYFKLAWPLGMLTVLAGCAVGPQYRMPDGPSAAQFHAPLPATAPQDTPAPGLGNWWRQFDDPIVPELVAQAQAGSPTMALALARIGQARAQAGMARSDRFPAIGAGVSGARGRIGEAALTRTVTRGLDASWEIDLFGGKRMAAEAARARLEARNSEWHGARVSLGAEVAATTVRYRACVRSAALLSQDADSRGQTGKLTAQKIKAGFTAPADGNLSAASAADARQRLVAQRALCDIDIKALVALTDVPEPALRARLDASDRVPRPSGIAVDTVPARALSQRPDIAAAEQDLRAASADINTAEANRYPSLSLGGDISVVRVGGVAQTLWSFGPAITAPLFDAGLRRNQANLARARYDESAASYQLQVRGAVREIEEALVQLDASTRREADAASAARDYDSYFKASEDKFRAGPGSLFELEVARRDALSAQQVLINVQQERVLAWIALYKALGGGWQAGPAPAERTNPT